MFAYCLNNPVNNVDSTGMRPVDINFAQHLGDGGCFIEDIISQYDDEKEGVVIGYSEHKKKGTMTPSNRNKHQKGQSRKDRDNGGEKGDARRKPNPNKRRKSVTTVNERNVDEGVVAQIFDRVINVGGAIALIFVTGSYITNVGVSGNTAVAPASTFFWFIPVKMDGTSEERQSVR